MSIYHDPALDQARRNLVARLLAIPSSATLEPFENQLTETLAWLCDHDTELARAILLGLVPSSEHDLVRGASAIGVATQLHLPSSGIGSSLRPDLSLSLPGRALQVLVEVKPRAGGFGDAYPLEGRMVTQPEAYAWAWSQLPAGAEARARFVGTLSEGAPPAASSPDPLAGLSVRRGGDLRWSDVACMIERRADEGATALIAQDLVEVLRARVLFTPIELSDDEIVRFLGRANDLLDRLRPLVRQAGLRVRRSIDGRQDYRGFYAEKDLPNGTLQLWIQLSVRGGRYNLRGRPDSLVILVKKLGGNPGDWGERFASAGLSMTTDITGIYRHYRILADAEPLMADPVAGAAQAAKLIAQLVDRIAAVS